MAKSSMKRWPRHNLKSWSDNWWYILFCQSSVTLICKWYQKFVSTVMFWIMFSLLRYTIPVGSTVLIWFGVLNISCLAYSLSHNCKYNCFAFYAEDDFYLNLKFVCQIFLIWATSSKKLELKVNSI